MLIAINGRLINNDSTLRICRGTYFIFYFISIKIDRYFLGNVDSINFFTISPPQLFLSRMWEYLAIVSQLSTRDDPFDPFEVVARKKKVSQVISSTACSERPDKPIYLETCATSRTVFLAWCDGTLHVCGGEGCRRNYFEGVGEISAGWKRKRGEIRMNRALEEFAMRLALANELFRGLLRFRFRPSRNHFESTSSKSSWIIEWIARVKKIDILWNCGCAKKFKQQLLSRSSNLISKGDKCDSLNRWKGFISSDHPLEV